MQVELTGCTGAGKTTLAALMMERGRKMNIDISLSTDFILHHIKLGWVKNKLARTLLIDLAAFLACTGTLRKNSRSYLLAIKIILRLPSAVGRFEKLNLLRNAVKKVGIYELLCRFHADQRIILVDEGTLHAAHNLFVHVLAEPDSKEFANFVKQVHLPDVAVHVTQRKPILIDRTIKRGHSRIHECMPDQVEQFIERAVTIFDRLMQQLASEGRVRTFGNCKNMIYYRASQHPPSLETLRELIAAETDVAQPEKPGGQSTMCPEAHGASN